MQLLLFFIFTGNLKESVNKGNYGLTNPASFPYNFTE